MTVSVIDRAANSLFPETGRHTRNIKYFCQPGTVTGEQLADYRQRVMAQIRESVSKENLELDSCILD